MKKITLQTLIRLTPVISFLFTLNAHAYVPSILQTSSFSAEKSHFMCEISSVLVSANVREGAEPYSTYLAYVQNANIVSHRISQIFIDNQRFHYDREKIEQQASRICQKRFQRHVSRHCRPLSYPRKRAQSMESIHINMDPQLWPKRVQVNPENQVSTVRLYESMYGHLMQAPLRVEDKNTQMMSIRDSANIQSYCGFDGQVHQYEF
jgi:hypothetical protein